MLETENKEVVNNCSAETEFNEGEIVSDSLKEVLENDSQTNTLNPLERFICNDCSKGLYYNYQLNENREVKHEGKKFQCDICDKSWAKEKNLIMHKEIKHACVRYDCDDFDFQ